MKDSLSIDYKEVDNKIIKLEIGGFLNLDTYLELREAFDKLIKEKNNRFIVDCGKLKRISSSGVHTFIYVTKVLENNNCVKLYNLPNEIKKIFFALELEDMFGCYDTYQESLEGVK